MAPSGRRHSGRLVVVVVRIILGKRVHAIELERCLRHVAVRQTASQSPDRCRTSAQHDR
jgi:hypothetical protein